MSKFDGFALIKYLYQSKSNPIYVKMFLIKFRLYIEKFIKKSLFFDKNVFDSHNYNCSNVINNSFIEFVFKKNL